ncbi:YdcF family protein [Larkinella sp. VNQ87]|uniref:YdcF family protein n=1 Tax=Larkinella sp. VNQ87 TaxID=3400921 RepID=UPI003C0F0954
MTKGEYDVLPGAARLFMKPKTAIVVLGNPATPDGRPSRTQQARVATAVRLYQQGLGSVIVCSGAAVYNSFVEAEVMADYAVSLGVPPEAVIREPTARSTYDNAARAGDLMRQLDIQQAIVVTSPAHVARARYIFSHYLTDFQVVSCGRDASWGRFLLLHAWEAWQRFRLWLRPDHRLPEKP